MSIESIERFLRSGRPEALMHAVGEQLSVDNPDGFVMHVSDPLFDVARYLDETSIPYETLPSPRPLLTYQWSNVAWSYGEPRFERRSDALRPRVASGRHRFEWEGAQFEVISLLVPTITRDREEQWLSAPSRELAERFFDAVCSHHAELRDEILVYKNGCWQKSPALYREVRRSRLDDLVLPDGAAERIRDDFRRFLDSAEFYVEHRIPWKRGALFLGPPGNGKTLCIKALIGELSIPCLYVQSFVAPRVPPQQCIGDVFDRARRTAPCLLVLEDVDSLVAPDALSFFLNELDGFSANEGLVTVASTNHPQRLDPALLNRPSRFDRKYHFDLPGSTERERYVARWNDQLAAPLRFDDITIEKLAAHTDGFSYAYLKELLLSALMRWSSDRERALGAIALEEVQELAAQMRSHEVDGADAQRTQ